MFGFFYEHSADPEPEQPHPFSPPATPPLPLSCPCLWRTGICHVRDCNPVSSFRGMLESSWISTWMTAASAASTVAVVTATVDATTSLWADSTPGRTTTKEAGSSVRSWCRATGGSLACWGGSDVGGSCWRFRLFLLMWMKTPSDKYSSWLFETKAGFWFVLLHQIQVSPKRMNGFSPKTYSLLISVPFF